MYSSIRRGPQMTRNQTESEFSHHFSIVPVAERQGPPAPDAVPGRQAEAERRRRDRVQGDVPARPPLRQARRTRQPLREHA